MVKGLNDSALYAPVVRELERHNRENGHALDEGWDEESSLVGWVQWFGYEYALWGDPYAWASTTVGVWLVKFGDGEPTLEHVGRAEIETDLLPAFKVACDDAVARNAAEYPS